MPPKFWTSASYCSCRGQLTAVESLLYHPDLLNHYNQNNHGRYLERVTHIHFESVSRWQKQNEQRKRKDLKDWVSYDLKRRPTAKLTLRKWL